MSLPNKPPKLRHKYTNAQVAEFILHPDRHRNSSKWQGMEIKDNQIFRAGKRVVTREELDDVLHQAWRETSLGRDKLFQWLVERYVGISLTDVGNYLRSNTQHQVTLPLQREPAGHAILPSAPLNQLQMILVEAIYWSKQVVCSHTLQIGYIVDCQQLHQLGILSQNLFHSYWVLLAKLNEILQHLIPLRHLMHSTEQVVMSYMQNSLLYQMQLAFLSLQIRQVIQ